MPRTCGWTPCWRAWAVAGVLALAATGCAGGGESGERPPEGPTGDAFYLPPEPLPAGEPGDVIRARPVAAPGGARAWRILYHSRALDGRDIAVSGLVVAPATADEDRPVVSFAHGTSGLADSCAPSKDPSYVETLATMAGLLDDGYVVVATDYEGLGPPGRHPYLVGESEARSTLDGVRAAANLAGAGASRRAVVYGHSQGGHAALFAGEIAPDYAPDVDLAGVVAGAPVTDLSVLTSLAASAQPAAGFLVMGAAGFAAAYPEADPAAVLTPAAAAAAGVGVERCAADVLGTYAGLVEPVLARDPLRDPTWAELIDENSAGRVPTRAPILVFHGEDDQLIPKRVVDRYVRASCELGNTVAYSVYRGEDHGGSFFASQEEVAAWIADRLAGQPPPSDC